jgi:hypothetical protein
VSPGAPLPSVTPLRPYALSYSFPTCRFLCASWWTAWTNTSHNHTWRACTDSVLATSEPFSVLIPSLRDPIDPVILPEPHWQGPVPDWQGIPCRIGRAELWLPYGDSLTLRPFSPLVLLPERDPPQWLPYALLGVQFLTEYHAAVSLPCAPGGGPGQLTIP